MVLSNVRPPKLLDAGQKSWNLERTYHGIWAINLIHISPWDCTLSLFENAAKYLEPGGRLLLYGAYKEDGRHTGAKAIELSTRD